MSKKKDESAATLERFERGLRKALATPSEKARKKAKAKRRRRST